jgi:hypothetical protein
MISRLLCFPENGVDVVVLCGMRHARLMDAWKGGDHFIEEKIRKLFTVKGEKTFPKSHCQWLRWSESSLFH